MIKKSILVISQLALGDAFILKKHFLNHIKENFQITVLCNSYNSFIFENFDKVIEDWPISRRPKVSFKKINSSNFDLMISPSGHLLEKLFTRIRFPFKQILIPVCEDYPKLQRSNYHCLYNCQKISIDTSNNWHEMYENLSKAILNLINLTDKILHEESIFVNDIPNIKQPDPHYSGDAIICPYSHKSGSYKNIPDDILIAIVQKLKPLSNEIFFISDEDEGKKIKELFANDLIFYTPRIAYERIRSKGFRFGIFAESFFNQLMHGLIKNHYTFFTMVDKFHSIASPPTAIPFYTLKEFESLFPNEK